MAEFDIKKREDRVGRYLKKYLDGFLFSEFSGLFLDQSDIEKVMAGVPIPLKKHDAAGLESEEGIRMLDIADNMAMVIGCDPHFEYAPQYIECMHMLYGDEFRRKLVLDAGKLASEGKKDLACIRFRAALCMDGEDADAMYGYARICRDMYLDSEDKEYTGRFKAESIEMFELLTIAHPEVDMGHYYLGYAYINLGMYKKAEIAWSDFLKLSENEEASKEIRERMAQLRDPVIIENGCNMVSTGRYEEGLAVLEEYKDSKFSKWWPLHYYMGIGYSATGRTEEAEEAFKKVLRLNASHLETMKELVELYKVTGNDEGRRKYEEKIKLVRKGIEEDSGNILC
ncbi:MAG: hypothetical protein IKS63_01085 [Firmicutes bacterium]|nr:hypothetical protein [Bacillota bacterium]